MWRHTAPYFCPYLSDFQTDKETCSFQHLGYEVPVVQIYLHIFNGLFEATGKNQETAENCTERRHPKRPGAIGYEVLVVNIFMYFYVLFGMTAKVKVTAEKCK